MFKKFDFWFNEENEELSYEYDFISNNELGDN